MLYLTVSKVIELYLQVMEKSGGTVGILSLASLESAIAQPRATFGGKELYPNLIEKASALGFSIIMNHPFIDGINELGTKQWKHFLSLMNMRLQHL